MIFWHLVCSKTSCNYNNIQYNVVVNVKWQTALAFIESIDSAHLMNLGLIFTLLLSLICYLTLGEIFSPFLYPALCLPASPVVIWCFAGSVHNVSEFFY